MDTIFTRVHSVDSLIAEPHSLQWLVARLLRQNHSLQGICGQIYDRTTLYNGFLGRFTAEPYSTMDLWEDLWHNRSLHEFVGRAEPLFTMDLWAEQNRSLH